LLNLRGKLKFIGATGFEKYPFFGKKKENPIDWEKVATIPKQKIRSNVIIVFFMVVIIIEEHF